MLWESDEGFAHPKGGRSPPSVEVTAEEGGKGDKEGGEKLTLKKSV